MPAQTTIILVVGAWHTEKHVEPITPYLETHGYRVLPIKLHTSGKHDPLPVIQDNIPPIVSAIKSEINSGNNVCLVGHSVSGQSCVLAVNEFLATASPSEKQKLVHLAFIACFLDAVRATASTTWYTINFETMWADLHDQDEIYDVFYNDMSREAARPFIDPLDSNRAQMPPEGIPEDWKGVRGTYFLCERDRAIWPEVQRLEAEESGMGLVEVEMGHCAFVSQPEAFAGVLVKAIEGA